ncbi:major capsid protein [Capybara microvirus Cap1_SP_240]|nr:major capsid protein [Capybara microvirus Cap1_SP_240]
MSKIFNNVSDVVYNRSQQDLSHRVLSDMKVGDLVPLDWQEVLPGDTWQAKGTYLVRSSSAFIKPIIDNLTLEIAHFFVPYRILYNKANGVFGNDSPSAYVNNSLGQFPAISSGIVKSGTVADYLGLPTGLEFAPGGKVSVLPFRAFAKIYNEWFRNENVIDPVNVQIGETGSNEVLNNNAWSITNYTGKLPKARKRPDYFTSCLPSPQKGSAIDLPFTGFFPLDTTEGELSTLSGGEPRVDINASPRQSYLFGTTNTEAFPNTDTLFRAYPATLQTELFNPITATNLGVRMDNTSVGLTVNDVRTAFALQKMLEKDARYGSRINEYYQGHWGVSNPDSRIQFTEYLDGAVVPLNMTQVAQTSAGTEQSPQANLSAFSQTIGYSKFVKSFSEFGIVMTVGVIRQDHTYSQGVAKKWCRFSREDFYDPLFANIGEQPVYSNELYLENWRFDGLKDTQIFGYNEAWAEYRFAPNEAHGYMRPDTDSLGEVWTLADHFENRPTLSKSFIEENEDNIKRVLVVQEDFFPQFMIDCYFNAKATRVLPVRSVPGLIDHH